MDKIFRRIVPYLVIGAVAGSLGLPSANAAELRVISNPAVARVLTDLDARIKDLTQRTLVVDVVAAGAMTSRLRTGERFDVAIAYEPDAMLLLGADQIRDGRLWCIGWTRLGVAAAAGAEVHGIGNVSRLKQSLLAAHSIGYKAGDPTGVQFRIALSQLGLLDKIGGKLVDVGAENPLDAVGRGEVELGVSYAGEIAAQKKARSLGALPWQVQQLTPIYAGVARDAQERGSAQRLIAFLTSFEGTAALTAHDLEGTPNE